MTKGRSLRLVHWHQDEANSLASQIRDMGWIVSVEHGATSGRLSDLRDNPPTLVVISLRRLPSHGREYADGLWSTKWGRAIPILFVDGDPSKLDALRTRFPDARFTSWDGLEAELRDAIPTRRPAT